MPGLVWRAGAGETAAKEGGLQPKSPTFILSQPRTAAAALRAAASRKARRALTLAAAALVCLCLVAVGQKRACEAGGGASPLCRSLYTQAALPGRCRVAIINNYQYHIDVMAAMTYAVADSGCQLDVFQLPTGAQGIAQTMQQWFSGGIYLPQQLGNATQYDLVVFPTYPTDHEVILERLLAHGPRHQHYLLVVHQPELLDRMAQFTLGGNPRIHLATIAPLVSTYLSQKVAGWEERLANPEIPWIAPLLPAAALGTGGCPGPRCAAPAATAAEPRQPTFCIQGGIVPSKRNYSEIIEVMRQPPVLEELRRMGAVLNLVGAFDAAEGTLPIKVPSNVLFMVQLKINLPFLEYWRELARCTVLLTAFATDRYYTFGASSTIATAVNLGLPLVAAERLLQAYPYWERQPDSVFTFQPGSPPSYGAALLRSLQPQKNEAARRAMAAVKAELAEHNRGVLGGIMAAVRASAAGAAAYR